MWPFAALLPQLTSASSSEFEADAVPIALDKRLKKTRSIEDINFSSDPSLQVAGDGGYLAT